MHGRPPRFIADTPERMLSAALALDLQEAWQLWARSRFGQRDRLPETAGASGRAERPWREFSLVLYTDQMHLYFL
ncbi:hypothetical protein GCM10009786_00910 [Leucobacter alluvii]|uniref:Uncharacterized protein n=1 Tax=Leucobacter alluvii TaxID=340321 RepID=A0ABN3B221_9MICO